MDCVTGDNPTVPQPFAEAALEQAGAVSEGIALPDGSDAWRSEVAARLERYRARRKPRAPRYPSLFLPFEPMESRMRALAATESAAAPAEPRASMALQIEAEAPDAAEAAGFPLNLYESPEPAANVIEFPRSAAIPVIRGPELAEAVQDRPRIVEAPEIVPAPPAMGGILIEPVVAREPEKRPSAEVPILPATIGRRVAASLIDGLILCTALAAFAVIFVRLNPVLPTFPTLAGSLSAVAVLLWCAYKYVFVVYTGSTPGLRALKLRLTRFDGCPTRRTTRRWRVLACFLSAFSLGLGYLWCLIDEDGLCWHDRITRTHIQLPGPAQ